jgi:uncharacterized membrane protein YGL010W
VQKLSPAIFAQSAEKVKIGWVVHLVEAAELAGHGELEKRKSS